MNFELVTDSDLAVGLSLSFCQFPKFDEFQKCPNA